MKTIFLNTLDIENFKGIKKQSLTFSEITNIYGDNATGKTTVFDSFTWLLFGKDSLGRSDFDIKRLDAEGNTSKKTEVKVEATIIVDQEEIQIKKVLKEIWRKTRGSSDTEFKGNNIDYYWNEVPVKKSEFDNNSSELIPEEVFKTLTNPAYFNQLPWKDQRETLTKLVTQKTKRELAEGNDAFMDLINKIGTKKTFKEYQAQIKASIKKASDEIKTIPSRIDEVEKSKPENIDFKSLEAKKEKLEAELNKTEDKLTDLSKAELNDLSELNDLKKQKQDLEFKVEEEESKIKNLNKAKETEVESKKTVLHQKIAGLKQEVAHLNKELGNENYYLAREQKQARSIEEQLVELRKQYHQVNDSKLEIEEGNLKCPTCNRLHETDDIEKIKNEMAQNFNFEKSEKLEAINKKGLRLKEDKETAEKLINHGREKINEIGTNINEKENEVQKLEQEVSEMKVETNQEAERAQRLEKVKALEEKREAIMKQIQDFKLDKNHDTQELKQKRSDQANEIKALENRINQKELIKKADKRIDELLDQEKQLAGTINQVEKELFIIEELEMLEMTDLENRINSKFKNISFKLFNNQINGGIKQTCEALINGVPFSSANNAARINAGLEITKVLSEFYKVSAPIFIDNRESIVELTDIKSQIINLIVKEGQTPLEIINH